MSTMIAEPSRLKHAEKDTSTKFLTFRLGDESYGIRVIQVREIIRLTAITAMPGVPEHVKGVINLRGKIIPVVSLRQRVGMCEATATDQTCIVVVQIDAGQGRHKSVGLIVDAVEEVVNIATSDVEPAPDFGADLATDSILGMAKIKGAVKSLLDIDQLLGETSIESAPSTV